MDNDDIEHAMCAPRGIPERRRREKEEGSSGPDLDFNRFLKDFGLAQEARSVKRHIEIS
jgi:hypothetical protein